MESVAIRPTIRPGESVCLIKVMVIWLKLGRDDIKLAVRERGNCPKATHRVSRFSSRVGIARARSCCPDAPDARREHYD